MTKRFCDQRAEASQNPGRSDLPLKQNGKKWNARFTYREEDGERLLAIMRNGDSIYTAAREIDVSVRTIHHWAEKIPEFGQALEHAKDYRRGWWEKQAKDHLIIVDEPGGPKVKFDTTLYKHVRTTDFEVKEQIDPTLNVTIGKTADDGTEMTLAKAKDIMKEFMNKDT